MAKKKVVQKESKELMTLPEGKLSSNTLASMANYDMKNFEGVELDVTQNKELFQNDIVIPKIWLIQAMSELRKQKKADEGDFADSRSEEILLPCEGKVEYIPMIVIKTFKRWQSFKIIGDKKEFISSEVMVFGKNEDLKYDDVIEGEKIIRRQVISAYVLLGEDAQKGIVKPYIIDFASTSKGAGRTLVSDIKVLNTAKINHQTGEIIRQGLPSWVAWFKLSKHEENGEHDYYVKDIAFGGLLPEKMLPFLKSAYDEITSLIDSNTIEIDDRDLHDAAKTPDKTKAKVNKKAAATSDAGI